MDDQKRLAHIEAQQERILVLLENLGQKMDERISAADEWRRKIERTIYGDGNGNKGHSIRVDRLEQAQERQKWLVRTLGAGFIVLALKSAAAFLGA